MPNKKQIGSHILLPFPSRFVLMDREQSFQSRDVFRVNLFLFPK